MRRTCEVCRADFEGGARAKCCSSTCRVRKHRGAGNVGVGAVRDAVLAELVDAGRADSAAGRAALAVAARLDVGRDTGSAVAALARELRAALPAALDGAAGEADPLFELQRRREARFDGI